MFKILKKWENIGIWGCQKLKYEVNNNKIGRQLPDSPPPQQDASDPISGLTGLCVYLFYPHIFPFQINIISLKF